MFPLIFQSLCARKISVVKHFTRAHLYILSASAVLHRNTTWNHSADETIILLNELSPWKFLLRSCMELRERPSWLQAAGFSSRSFLLLLYSLLAPIVVAAMRSVVLLCLNKRRYEWNNVPKHYYWKEHLCEFQMSLRALVLQPVCTRTA